MTSSDVELRTEFVRSNRQGQMKLFRANILVGAALFVAFFGWDLIVSDRPSEQASIRGVVAVIGVVVYFLTRTQLFERYYEFFYIGVLAVAGIAVALLVRNLSDGYAIGVGAPILVIVASSVLIRAGPWQTAIAGLTVCAPMIFVMVVDNAPSRVLWNNVIFLFTTLIITVIHAYQAEHVAFEVYKARWELESEKEETEKLLADVTQMREERLGWLENLARFLRHEIKNQVVAARGSMDLMATKPLDEPTRKLLDRARLSLARMLRLVRSATEASDLRTALGFSDIATFDLSGLVQEKVLEFREMLLNHEVRDDIEPYLFIKGSQDRIAQLLDKLLENAMEHATGEVHVNLRLDEGELVSLRVENEGPTLPSDRERLFDLFVSIDKGQDTATNIGLGLYIARAIADAHGGSIEAYDLPEARGAGFLVQLPVIALPAPETAVNVS